MTFYNTPGEFWAGLLNLLSGGFGGQYTGYLLLLFIGVAVYKFVGSDAAVGFGIVGIGILGANELVPSWLVIVDILVVVMLFTRLVYERYFS